MAICVASGFSLSVLTTCSEKQVFKSKRIAGEYPKLQEYAPVDDEVARVWLCDGCGLGLSAGLFYCVGGLTCLMFPSSQPYFALERAAVQSISGGLAFRSVGGFIAAFVVVLLMENSFPTSQFWFAVWKSIVAAMGLQAGSDLTEMIADVIE